MQRIFPPYLNYRDLLVRLFLSFFLTICLLHVYEWVRISQIQLVEVSWFKVVTVGLVEDFLFSLAVFAILLPLYLFFRLLLGPFAGSVLIWICVILILISVAISNYFIVANVPLEADLWGYSIADIINTIQNSAEVDLIAIAALFFFPLCTRLLSRLFPFKDISLLYRGVLYTIIAGVIVFTVYKPKEQSFSTRTGYFLALSKPSFFAKKSIAYLYDKGRPNTYSEKVSENPYPFEQKLSNTNTLSPYFTTDYEVKPNVLFIGIEGLGADFVYKGEYAGFMPFTDSLITKSLYWENALSNTGRTFGFLPSILAGLPYANQGFLETGPNYAKHTSIVQVLNQNNYATKFYYGGNSNFDKMGIFLEHQQIDEIIDKSTLDYRFSIDSSQYVTNYWGYEDAAVLETIIQDLKSSSSPSFVATLSLTSHEPFEAPYSIYETKSAGYSKKLGNKILKTYEKNKGVFACLSYVDKCIENLVKQIQSDSTLKNTIVVITGDHRLIPLPMSSSVSRFRVPLLVWSPLLEKTKVFSDLVAHSDVYPSMLALLDKNFGVHEMPETIQSISEGGLKVLDQTNSNKSFGLMRNKGDLNQLVMGDLLLVDNTIYKLGKGYSTEVASGETIEFSAALLDFKDKNAYTIDSNKVYSGLSTAIVLKMFELNDEEKAVVKFYKVDTIGVDSALKVAYTLAFDGDRIKARALCKEILNRTPNYTDARILLGRTYAWDGMYAKAIEVLKQAVKRNPNYDDVYIALSDAYRWSGNKDSAKFIISHADSILPNSKAVKIHIAKNFKDTLTDDIQQNER